MNLWSVRPRLAVGWSTLFSSTCLMFPEYDDLAGEPWKGTNLDEREAREFCGREISELEREIRANDDPQRLDHLKRRVHEIQEKVKPHRRRYLWRGLWSKVSMLKEEIQAQEDNKGMLWRRKISTLREEKRALRKDMKLERLKEPCKVLLLATLKELENAEMELLHWHLSQGEIDGFPPIPYSELKDADRQKTVDLLVKKYGPTDAVKITAKILRKINLNPLADTLEDCFIGAFKASLHPSTSADNSFSLPVNSNSHCGTSASVKRPRRTLLQNILEELKDREMETFKWYLTKGQIDGFDPIPEDQLQDADRENTVELMWQRYGPERALEITRQILKKMNLDHINDKFYSDANGAEFEEPPAKRRAFSSSPPSSLHPTFPGQDASNLNSSSADHEARMTGQPCSSTLSSFMLSCNFLMKHKGELERRIGNVRPLLSALVDAEILNDEEKEEVEIEKTRVKKNEALLNMVKRKGAKAQEALYRALKEEDPTLVQDLEE